MKRFFAALSVALPMAWLATGIADHSGWGSNSIGMCLIAPGLALVLNNVVPVGHPATWLGTAGLIGMTALAGNLAYYTALCYGFLTVISAMQSKQSER